MEDRNYFFQILSFAAVCIALCAGVWFGLHVLQGYRDEYDTMVSERDNFEGIMETLRAKNRTLQKIHNVNLSDIKMIRKGSENEFYAAVHRLIGENSLSLLSMQNDNPSIFKLSLQGNYYSLIHLFADWRSMPFASRITELHIKRDAAFPADLVTADLVLEAWIAQ